jgi:hypothetical protein
MANSLKRAAQSQKKPAWDEGIREDTFTIPSQNTRVRLFPHIVTVRQHYVEFISEKKGKTGFYKLCLNWNCVDNEQIDGNCPLCEHGNRWTEHHYGYLFGRKAAAKGNVVVQPVRMTGKLVGKISKLSEIVYADIEDADDRPDATDAKGGFDIFLSQTNVNSKVEYDCNPSDKTPLTKAELKAFEDYIGDNKDIEKLVKPDSREELLNDMHRIGLIGEGAKGKSKPPVDKAAAKAKYDGYDSTDDPAVPAKPNKAAGKPAPKKQTSVSGDDDDDDVAPAASGRKTPLDDDDGPERSYSNPDEDDAPVEDADE